MYHQFNIHQLYVLSTRFIYVFCVHLITNSDYFPLQHELTSYYNRDGMCLLCGTDWAIKCNSSSILSLQENRLKISHAFQTNSILIVLPA
jgi:hypothetical protein